MLRAVRKRDHAGLGLDRRRTGSNSDTSELAVNRAESPSDSHNPSQISAQHQMEHWEISRVPLCVNGQANVIKAL
jgi:hypothetical protein